MNHHTMGSFIYITITLLCCTHIHIIHAFFLPKKSISTRNTMGHTRSLKHIAKDHIQDVLTPFSEAGVTANNMDLEGTIQLLKRLKDNGAFQEKDHERAKETFQNVMQYLGLKVTYVDASSDTACSTFNNKECNGNDNNNGNNIEHENLDTSIFHWSKTIGVEKDIVRASRDPHHKHIFSVASQFNAAEAPYPFTPGIGEAMRKSDGDRTQGPLAQRTNPVVFELVTAFLTNLGFNMMEYVLPSAGTTYTPNSLIEHGYLRPTDATISKLSAEIAQYYAKMELPCYESIPNDGGEYSVHLILSAAPAIGYSNDVDATKTTDLQYYAYLANFSCQFKFALSLLREFPDEEVVLHVTGTGLGVFGCSSWNFANAFRVAGLAFQKSLSAEEANRIHVQLEAFGGHGLLKNVAEKLQLGNKKARVE